MQTNKNNSEKLKRIIVHWTGGSYNVNMDILNSYHYAITDVGRVMPCNHRPEDNLNCNDGNYAAHTGGGNTGSIGVAMCGMYVPKGVNIKNTQYPLTKKQCESCFKFVAELADKYKIQINPDTVMTHYEFGLKNPKTSSAGKIDIIYLPAYPSLKQSEIGDFIRNKVRWYSKHL